MGSVENFRTGHAGAEEPQLSLLDAGARRRLDAWLTAEMAYHHGICNGLETLADQLPVRVDAALVSTLLGLVERSWADHMRAHRELTGLLTSVRVAVPELALLEAEHDQICGANDEVVEQLGQLARGERVNADALGYILRWGFESRRRHLAWERAVLLRLATGVMAEEARETLTRWCATHPEPVLPFILRTRTSAQH